jgi:hypothetical protein
MYGANTAQMIMPVRMTAPINANRFRQNVRMAFWKRVRSLRVSHPQSRFLLCRNMASLSSPTDQLYRIRGSMNVYKTSMIRVTRTKLSAKTSVVPWITG